MENIFRTAGRVLSRIKLFDIAMSCAGIWAAYLLGMYVTGSFHSSSRWMGAMLACTSVVAIQQKGSYRESLKAGLSRVSGTLIGAVVAYVYLLFFPFTEAGMMAAVVVLEMMLMMCGMYANGQMAVVTLLIIMLVSKQSPDASPALNAMLRFCESAVGSGVGVALLWVVERWNNRRNSRRNNHD